MTIEQFRAIQRSRPFQPFAIHVADGRMLEVRHPEVVGASPNERTIFVYNADGMREVLDLLLVTSLRPLTMRLA